MDTKPEVTTTVTEIAQAPSTGSTSNPKFFLGDDDSNSSSDASLSENESSSKPIVSTTLTDNPTTKSENGPTDPNSSNSVNKLLAAKPFGVNKLNQGGQVASSSWSSLKNAAAASTANSSTLANARDDTDGSTKSVVKNVDAFQKFKMQMIEKQMKEQENLKSLKEREQILSK